MMPSYVLAILLVSVYACWCVYLYKKHYVQREQTIEAELDWQNTWLIAYASQTGQAAELAQQTAQRLGQARLVPLNQLSNELLGRAYKLLLVVSSYGEGEAPDNARYFLSAFQSQNLSHLSYALLALGDSKYHHFCGYAKQVERLLDEHHATALFNRIEVDRLNLKALQLWQRQLGLASNFTQAEFISCQLVDRRCVNEGSQAWPAYYLRFKAAENHSWQAGDIAQILIADEVEHKQAMMREYSIASLAESGEIELLIRQHEYGVGSGWLTQTLPVWGEAAIRVRSNTTFHLPQSVKKAIFIANGTGIAGVRAHLLQAAGDNWLIFGERQADFDVFFKQDIQAWQEQGTLAYCDLAFSRQQPKRYVQDYLLLYKERLQEYLRQGAAIVICGSKQGMAEGVEQVLLSIIGQQGLRELIEQGRYVRDVY